MDATTDLDLSYDVSGGTYPWRYAGRRLNRSEALRALLDIGLDYSAANRCLSHAHQSAAEVARAFVVATRLPHGPGFRVRIPLLDPWPMPPSIARSALEQHLRMDTAEAARLIDDAPLKP